jgi:hypothetical protein
MSDSLNETPHSLDKETVPIAPANSDVEAGDQGILVHAAPLARKLKGRHMQMIAIGKYSYMLKLDLELIEFSPRWCNWSWVVRRIWKCFGDWRTWKFGMCDASSCITFCDSLQNTSLRILLKTRSPYRSSATLSSVLCSSSQSKLLENSLSCFLSMEHSSPTLCAS